MKKIGIIAGCTLLIIVVGMFLINANRTETDVTKDRTKVGVLLNGNHEDCSWSQSHYEAMEKTAEELNLEILYRENVPEDATCMAIMEELIAEGCEILVCNSFQYGEWELQVAEKHPEVYFFHAAGTETSRNMSTYFGRIYQMRYLSGIVAGLQTETNQIGYVAAYPISEVNRGINAFTLGVRSVNPDAVVYVQWCDTWTDEEMTREAAGELLNAYEIDVLAMHSDAMAPLEVAEEKGVWSIGYNMDNSQRYPHSFLTAPVWKWECFYTPHILECLQGKFEENEYWEGVETGIVDLAPFTGHVKDGIAEAVEAERARLQSGTYDVFYGPIFDSEGNLRVTEGETMSDRTLLNEFDWYVEGVIINDENQ